jgi:epsilon-lactone hydrolase
MTILQPLPPQDALPVAAMRQAASAHTGEKLGPEARAMFAATPAVSERVCIPSQSATPIGA